MVYKFIDKSSTSSGGTIKSEIMANEQLKFERCKVYSSFKNNIKAVDLVDMQLISTYNKGFRFTSSVIDIFSKYAWVVPLKEKKYFTIINAFQKFFNEFDRKPNKTWVDKGIEIYNRSVKS